VVPAFILYLLAALLVLVGLAGVVLPALPGLPLVFAGLLLAAWADGFQHVGWIMLTVLGLLMVVSFAVDLLSSAVGAKGMGASRLAIAGSLLGSVAGLLFLPWGLLLGPFVGALIGEYLHSRKLGLATRVGLATWLGMVLGVALKLGLGLAMLGLFGLAWWL
jgi:uncharacterized protein YqgC (DUF456 family)